jgi:integrase
MEHGEYLAIRKHLPAAYQDVLDFGYLSGWRRGEVLTMEWRDVDREGRVIRLRPEVGKTREGRVLVLSAPLHAVMERRWHARTLGCSLVFHEAARSLQGFKNAWERACEAAGVPGKLFHDLRRTAIRNMVRAGIPERVAMQPVQRSTPSKWALLAALALVPPLRGWIAISYSQRTPAAGGASRGLGTHTKSGSCVRGDA